MQMKERPKRVSKHKGKKSGARHMRNAAEMPLSRRYFYFASAILGISETMNNRIVSGDLAEYFSSHRYEFLL